MSPERWRQIDNIFSGAVDLPEREAANFLDSHCGDDPELRAEVEALLEVDRREVSDLAAAIEQAALQLTKTDPPESRSIIGRRIGPYQIVREIGRGGMGTVYQALRVDDQYRGSVAIKFIAHGFDSRDSLSRFRTERQILATLQHPNIAALLDGGTTDDGGPYIVMEFIDGEPLLESCRRRNLSIPERLQLFSDLCSAVHHAHQMLVIHRDIKPANVLVTKSGVPKLLDFGIAKLLAPEMAPGDYAPTVTAMRLLTPQYASPEQIRGDPLTTATDVYSLGVLLYELLTFSTPYRVNGRTPQEIERAVCETEPQKLSTGAGTDIRLRKQLSGDLENIVAMALRKEPQRRYGSVQQFSDDIQRFLKGQPISAREDTLFYRAGKLVRRNRLASGAFAMLAISVIGGWTATVRQARRTEARFQEVRKLSNALMYDIHASIQKLPGSTAVREQLVKTALEYLNNLSKDSADDPGLMWDLSQAYEHVGDVQGDPSGPNLGRHHEALESYKKALDLVERHASRGRDYEVLQCLAWLHFKRGDLEFRLAGNSQAVASYEQGLAAGRLVATSLKDARADDLLRNGYQRKAMTQVRLGDIKAGLESARAAAAAADRALARSKGGERTVNAARTWLLLGNILWLSGDLHSAWSHYQRAVTALEELMRTDQDNAVYAEQLEEAYRRSGDLLGNPAYFHFDDQKGAEQFLRRALQIAERLAGRDAADAQAQADLGITLRRLGAVMRTTETAAAVAYYRRSLAISTKLLDGAPDDRNYARDVANTRLGLAIALRHQNKYAPALEELQTVIAMQRNLVARSPDHVVVREDMFDAQLALGELQLAMHDFAGAEANLTDALDTARLLREKNSDSLYAQRCFALAAKGLGDYHMRLARMSGSRERVRQHAEARKWYDKALEIWSNWLSRDLALPYSENRRSQVLQARSAAGGLESR
jgi:eukaryotic-like serine/threonine-protein kinase